MCFNKNESKNSENGQCIDPNAAKGEKKRDFSFNRHSRINHHHRLGIELVDILFGHEQMVGTSHRFCMRFIVVVVVIRFADGAFGPRGKCPYAIVRFVFSIYNCSAAQRTTPMNEQKGNYK